MILIKDKIETIKQLISQGTNQSLVYAALECRLAIEIVCYERLKLSLDKMSISELEWQPRKIINQILAEENCNVTKGFTLSVSTTPVGTEAESFTLKDYESKNYVVLGNQSELDIRKLVRIYQALSGLALHISIPTDKKVKAYGDAKEILRKVKTALNELEAISNGTLLLSGIGPEYNFSCMSCNSPIIRKVSSLFDGKIVHCNNCIESYGVSIQGDKIFYMQNVYDLPCDKCNEKTRVPKNKFRFKKIEEIIDITCCHCQNIIKVRIMPTLYKK
ncbi:hypothetical protein [Vibrio sp. 3-2(1)]|uniref:hypothetical protein n=1 Tax=Vibrio sp. 3-2(1) TaxID=2591016 RepID=UPI0014827C61|nr:hypothetical protein [Vibrio sp. 3-2(1)]NNN70897.1 hypothetical protein [Vibrio sp. 3-2(1)]